MRLKNVIAAAVLCGSGLPAMAVSNISTTSSFAYGANIGWLNWRPSDSDGVHVGTLFLSGNVWSANCGWISLGDGAPSNGHRYQNDSGTDFGVNLESDGTLSGMAYGANIGWITFTDTTALGNLPPAAVPRIELKTGRFRGYCYSANCGWINLGTDFSGVKTMNLDPGPDSDSDGIPDAWELQHAPNLNQLTANGDFDGDGLSDREEYLADTNPKNAADRLRITAIVAKNAGDSIDLTWSSKPSRCYRIQTRDDLFQGGWLEVAPPGLINPDPGSQTKRTVAGDSNPMQFYRVESVVPGGDFGP